MKKELLFAGLFTLLLFSCDNNDVAVLENGSNNDGVEMVVHAIVGDVNSTKTAVQSNGTDIYWTPGNAINLFYGDYSSGQFTTAIASPSASATFTGTISAVTGTTEAGGAARSFWGVYPYNVSNSCDGSGVTLTIPGTQSGVAGTFADNLNPTVAKSPNLDLTFYNVGSWFIFSVARNDIVSASLQGNNSENIAGTVRVEMNPSSRPQVTDVTSGITSITITPTDSVCFKVGKHYYMVLIPQTLSSGYSLTLAASDGSFATFVINDSRTFDRNSYIGKENVDNGLIFVSRAIDLGLSVKWASFNIGASSPEESGYYYSWGETEPKNEYYGETYSKDYIHTDLSLEDDVAHAKWGGDWRMPTKTEMDELISNCTWEWYSSGNSDFGGVAGYKVTSTIEGYTDRFIFLPAASWNSGSSVPDTGKGGYWSSSIGKSVFACFLLFSNIEHVTVENGLIYREMGLTVRPVCP